MKLYWLFVYVFFYTKGSIASEEISLTNDTITDDNNTTKTVEAKLENILELNSTASTSTLGDKNNKSVELDKNINHNKTEPGHEVTYANGIQKSDNRRHDSLLTKEDEEKIRLDLVQSVQNKIEKLAKKMLENENVTNVVIKLRDKVTKLLKKHSCTESEQRNYVDLIMRGIVETINKDTRRFEERKNSKYEETTTVEKVDHTNKNCSFEDTCIKIYELSTISCKPKGRDVILDDLCDGEKHCKDGSDEFECNEKIADKLKSAIAFMHTLNNENITQCVQELGIEDKLATILKEEHNLTQFTEVSGRRSLIRNSIGIEALVETLKKMHELFCEKPNITTTVTTYDALRTTMMIFLSDDANRPTPKPPQCNCTKGKCVKDCDRYCVVSCDHRWKLSRWQCDVNTTLHLNSVCNGIVECSDGTDEQYCSQGMNVSIKFKINRILNNLIQTLHAKMKTLEYSRVIPDLIKTSDDINKIQKAIIHDEEIKPLRDEIIRNLEYIYSKIFIDEKYNDTFNFLSSVKDSMMEAVKLRFRQYRRNISPTGCECYGDVCRLPGCSKECAKICQVQNMFHMYNCSKNSTDGKVVNITLQMVCNQQRDCPNSDDELACNKELCQKHHFVWLSREIQLIGVKDKGTSAGEIIDIWKSKVSKLIKNVTGLSSLKKDILRSTIHSMSNELVLVYGFTHTKSKNTDVAVLKKFKEISQKIMFFVKLCGT